MSEQPTAPLINVTIRLASGDDFDAVFAIWMEGIDNSFDTTDINEAALKEKFSRAERVRSNGVPINMQQPPY